MNISTVCSSMVVLILFTSYGEVTLDNSCVNWSAYKDEKCFFILDDITRTFADAEKACEKLENAPTLAVIHSKDEQEFLSNYLFNVSKKLENFWLCARVMNSKVSWIDNSELGYTNWDSKGPRNKTNYCVQMESDESLVGKWIDEPCEKKNLVVCQRMQTWSMVRLQKTLLDSRKESRDAQDEANKQINNLKQMLESEKASSSKSISDLRNALEVEKNSNHKNITDLRQNLIPIGFVYPQLPNEKSPSEIWPSMTWTDVSATYAGVFFRVIGAGSELFGQTQAENAPRLVAVNDYYLSTSDIRQAEIKLNTGTTSEYIYTGDFSKEPSHHMHLKFEISGGEVRPPEYGNSSLEKNRIDVLSTQ